MSPKIKEIASFFLGLRGTRVQKFEHRIIFGTIRMKRQLIGVSGCFVIIMKRCETGETFVKHHTVANSTTTMFSKFLACFDDICQQNNVVHMNWSILHVCTDISPHNTRTRKYPAGFKYCTAEIPNPQSTSFTSHSVLCICTCVWKIYPFISHNKFLS